MNKLEMKYEKYCQTFTIMMMMMMIMMKEKRPIKNFLWITWNE
jgi:hypothetical protein